MQKLLDRERRICKGPFRSTLGTHKTFGTHKIGRAVMLRGFSGGKLLGWALIIYHAGVPDAHFYVLKEHRRRGLGRDLWHHVQRFGPDPLCFPVGRRGRSFFRAVGATNVE